MKFYKIVHGYRPEDYIEIDETELEKAYHAFLMRKDAVFSGGAVRGSEIKVIQPDYHRAMGWNRGYILGPDDYAELSDKGINRAHMNLLAETKVKVEMLLKAGRADLVGKNIPLSELDFDRPKELTTSH